MLMESIIYFASILLFLIIQTLSSVIVEALSAQAQTRLGGLGGITALRHSFLTPPSPLGVSCDFERPCTWQWKNNTTPPGFNVVSGKQLFKQITDLPPGNFTGPVVDYNNSSDGHFLFVYITEGHPSSQREVHLTSPKYVATGEQCRLEMTVSMRMAGGNFKVVVETVNRTSWVVSEKPCNDKNQWERYSVNLGRISQEFHVTIEVTPGRKTPSYFAIDNLRFVDCFPEVPPQQECTALQFKCSNKVCIDRSQVCDLTKDCNFGEDEEQECDKMPPFSRCPFEDGWCGWRNVVGKDLNWTRHSGRTPTNLTGPSNDHTYENSTGMYMFVDMSKIKHLGASALMESAVFNPPPRYHGNKSSPYYNSCQIRFHYHMLGPHSGSLTLFLVHLQPHQKVSEGTWYQFGDKGDHWHRAVITLPNMTHRYSIQFEGRRGFSSKGDIAVDDFSLSPECFGIGVPANETDGYNYYDTDSFLEPTQSTVEHEDFANETYYVFSTCGQTGRIGPTPQQCAVAYNRTSSSVTVLQELPLAGVQKWVVPHTGYYTIIAKGASGGQGSAGQGISRGAMVRTVVELTTGEPVFILVGQPGINAVCSKGDPQSRCQPPVKSSLRDAVREVRNLTVLGGGGGGGGGTYIFTINKRRQRIPLLVAGGGGGLGHGPLDISAAQIQHGQGFNLSRGNSSGTEHGSAAAGAGGGWDEGTGSRRPARGTALLEGAFGGEPCTSSQTIGAGGFGGGGGGCTSGGGGGGYAGGDAWSERRRSGQGGFSMVRNGGTMLTRFSMGSHDGPGSVLIIPSLDSGACGCDYRCVALDEYRHHTQCVCPEGWLLGNDSTSCQLPIQPNNDIPTSYIVGFIGAAAVVMLCVGTVCMTLYTRYQRKKSERMRRKAPTGPDLQLSRLRVASGGMMTEYNPNYEFGGGTYTIQDLKEIPRDHLRLVKALGQGAFGEVYQGFYKTRAGDAVEMPVAVKTLPELSSSQAEMDFLMEALIMSKFSHPNIVHFIGVCFDNHPRFIVLELLAGGDLKTFLREARPKPDKPSPLTMKDLLLCTIDIAKGCKYMEENHFIHRDIASRNCLLTTKGPGRVVKIADFGMARDIYRADYYRKGGKAMLPVKWMPPEAFLDGIFTSKTDVWSFGVLMWEVMSLGYMPYTGRGNQEVMQLVTNGGRLEPPSHCPAPVYGIMTQCWHPIPDDRPSFGTILERIGYCMQDPDVMRSPLPVFHRPPSSERDTTVMRPPAHDGSCLLAPRCQSVNGGSASSNPAADYLVPLAHSIEMHSSPSGGSAEHLLGTGSYGCLTENSWETSFVRKSKRDDEDEYDEEIASCPRSSQHHLDARAPLSPAPPPPDDDDDDDEEVHVAPQQMPSVSSTESSEVSSRSVPEMTHPTDDKPAVSSTSLISLENHYPVLNNNHINSSSSTSSSASKRLRDYDDQNHLKSKLPLQGSLSLDAATLSRQHTTPVLPPPLQYANVSPNSINSSAEDVMETPPERRRPYSVQTTPQSRRLLNDNEISC